MITLAESLSFRTAVQVNAALLADAAANGLPANSWSALSLPRGLFEVLSRDRATQEAARYLIVAGGFLDTASGPWLKLLAKGFFNVDPLTASFAKITLRLTNTGAVPTVSRVANTTWAVTKDSRKLRFRNSGAITVAGTLNAYQDVEYTAEYVGTSYNIAPGDIEALTTGIPGITVSSPAVGSTGTCVTTAAIDDETEPAIKARCRARWGTTGAGGNADAVAFWIIEAFTSGAIPATITGYAIDDANPHGPGSLAVYLRNAAGPATAAEVLLVDAYLQLRKALGTTRWSVSSGSTFSQAVAGTIYHSGSTTALADAIVALTALAAAYPMGPANLYADDCKEAVLSVPGVYRFLMTTPTPESVVPISGNGILAFTTGGLVAVSGTP